MTYEYYNLDQGLRSANIELLLPGFEPGRESVAVISPHDDDALLGAGYLIQAAQQAGASVRIMIVCDGSAGYSRVEDKPGIQDRRKKESREAYRLLGIASEDLIWFDVPDFSALHYLGWKLPGGGEGLFARIVPKLREWRATRLLIPNGHREHLDHTASCLAGVFCGPQTGDAVLADWGRADPIKSSLVYSVWSDLPPRPGHELRADRAIIASPDVEVNVMEALKMFASQADVISGLVKARAERIRKGRAMELFLQIDPRPRLDYNPYWEIIDEIG